MNLDPRIIEALNNDSLVLFVGAGMSNSLGYPSWGELIKKILVKIGAEVGDSNSKMNFSYYLKNDDFSNPFEALDDLEANGFKSRFKELMYEEFEQVSITNENTTRHDKLWQISSKIITTNYDKVLEFRKPHSIKVVFSDNEFLQSQSLQGQPFLYKIHGDIDNPSTCVLFTSDYNDLYNSENANLSTIQGMMQSKTFLFLGFSMNDPFVSTQLERLNKLYNGFSPQSFIVSTSIQEFKDLRINTVLVDDWKESFDKFLDVLVENKRTATVLKNDVQEEEVNIDLINDVLVLQGLLEKEMEEVIELEGGMSDKEKTKKLYKIRDRIKFLINEKMDVDFQSKIPNHIENELEHIFDSIIRSQKLSRELIGQINKIREEKSQTNGYQWYHRSVIVSALACSLVNFKDVDQRKIELLIDFTNDSESKVWQKAITYLFLTLNHLGNKWRRFDSVKRKLNQLKEQSKIQDSLRNILIIMQSNLQSISPIDKRIFENDYFKDSTFNYFLPFYPSNPSVDKLYDNEFIENVDEFVESLYETPLPDSTKYLFCNSESKQIKKMENESEKSSKWFVEMVVIHRAYEPYLNVINEFLNFYENCPNIESTLKKEVSIINVKNFKEHLLNAKEQYRAMARHFQLKNDHGQAIKNWESLLKIDSEDQSALFNVANLYDQTKVKVEKKLKTRLKIDKLMPENDHNLYKIGYYYRQLDKFVTSLKYTNAAIEKNDSEIGYYVSRANSNSAIGADDNIRLAIEDYDFAIEKGFEKALCFNNRGICKENLGDFEGAIEDYNSAIEIEPKDGVYYSNRSTSKRQLDDFDGALSDLEKAYELKGISRSKYYNQLACVHRCQGDYEEAHKRVDQAIRMDKNESKFYGSKAAIFSSQGNEESFYEYLEKALERGARVHWFDYDILLKYKSDEKFNKIVEKYKKD